MLRKRVSVAFLRPKKLKSRPKYILPLYFDNKGLQFLRLSNILHDADVKSKLPDQFREDESPAVVFNLTNTIRNKILNYKDTVSSIDVNDSESYGTGLLSCNCSSSDFVDQHHGHVLTGDLRIIENVHLRQLIIVNLDQLTGRSVATQSKVV